MRIATWNVNGLRARLEFMQIWLNERHPDIVGLQELKVTAEEFPRETFEALGYHVLVHGQKGWNGVAILSRSPAELTIAGLPDQADLGARLITANVEGLSFTTVYCPNGKDVTHVDFPRKLAWFESLIEHWRDVHRADESAVLCGDFNIVPAAADSWRGEAAEGTIFHTEDERRRFRDLTNLGLFDLYRERHPEDQAFSWWDYRGGAFHRGHGLRIDFLLATAPVLERVSNVEIDRDFRKKKDGLTASDHAPVLADLD